MSSAVVSATQRHSSPAREGLFVTPRSRTALFAVLLAVLTVAAYYPAHHDPFINFDDDLYVTNNDHVNHGLSWDAVKWSFTTYHAFNWHPLTWLVHELDVQIFGLNPAGHHDVNLFLHVTDVVLLFWVLQRATGYAGRSFAVAALFALHPLNVESVAWVAELKTMLSMFFFLLALGAYRWYAREPRVGRYLPIAGLFVLGLMAKPQVITLPFVFLLWDYWPLGRMFASDPESAAGTVTPKVIPGKSFSWLLWEKVPFGLIIAVSSFVTMKAQRVGRPFNWSYSIWTRGANAIVAYARYIGKAFWPSHLALLYPHPGTSLSRWQILGASLVLLAITAVVAVNWRRRYLVVGWLWFLGTMVPMIGVVQVGRQAMADRYAYLPFIGLFIMICWSVAEWTARRRLPGFLLPCTTALVLAGMIVVTHHQLGYWRDSVDLWSHTLQVTSNNWVAEYHVGAALKKQGHVVEALQCYYRALAMNPNDEYSNVAIAFYEHENGINLPDAIEHYKKALDRMDDESKIQLLVNMGHVYDKLGDSVHARQSLEAAEKLRAQLKP
jgi:protein O-mannosyl-transferase